MFEKRQNGRRRETFPPYRVDFPSNPSKSLRKISLSGGKIPAHPLSHGYEFSFLQNCKKPRRIVSQINGWQSGAAGILGVSPARLK